MMSQVQRPAIFKWRHFAPEVILCAVRWYLRYSLSYREVEELLVERGLEIDHTTVWRLAHSSKVRRSFCLRATSRGLPPIPFNQFSNAATLTDTRLAPPTTSRRR